MGQADDDARARRPAEATDEVPIGSQARAIMMRAAQLRRQAMELEGDERARLLEEANRLEEDAVRMARGEDAG